MSSLIVRKTSESTAPRATKTQVIEALVLAEMKAISKHNEEVVKEMRELHKKIQDLAIAFVANKPAEEFVNINVQNYYKRVEVHIPVYGEEIETLLEKQSKLQTKTADIKEIRRSIKELLANQENRVENPLLRPENLDKVTILLEMLKNPQTINLEAPKPENQ
jgi:cation transport regulator ChaC